jgi:hypothetical protein
MPATRPRVFADFELAPAVASDLGLRDAVEQASLILEDVVKGSPSPISVRWDRFDDDKAGYVTVRLKDATGEVQNLLPTAELESIPKLRRRFLALYDGLLRIRSKRHLENLDRMAAAGES